MKKVEDLFLKQLSNTLLTQALKAQSLDLEPAKKKATDELLRKIHLEKDIEKLLYEEPITNKSKKI